MTGPAEDSEELDGLRTRARKRWLTTTISAGVAAGVIGGVITPLLSRHRHQPHQHGDPVAALIGVVLVVALGGVAVFFMYRRMWQGKGIYAPPLIAGLKRADRRAVMRAIKRADPSADPTLAAVERATAQRLVDQAAFARVIFGLAVVVVLYFGLTHHNWTVRVLLVLCAVIFLGMLGFGFVQVRRAQRYLAAVGPGPQQTVTS